MAFRADRLRVQIPCGSTGSVIELGGGLDPDEVFAPCGDSPQSAFCPPPREPPPPPPPCGIPSPLFADRPWDWLVNPVIDVGQRVVLDADDLPALKRQLELRLKVLEVAEHATAAVREQLEQRLLDVSNVEQSLRERE